MTGIDHMDASRPQVCGDMTVKMDGIRYAIRLAEA